MNIRNETTELIDRYLRDELVAEEEVAFETALLESPDLQLQLETAMAIQQAILLADEIDSTVVTDALPAMDARNNWQPLALAASVTLALFSTTMYWKLSNETGLLHSEIDALNQPRTSVLTVPVDIMRSADQQTPDVIIRKPGADALLVLDIELSQAVAGAGQLQLVLRDTDNTELFSWAATSAENGRLNVAFSSGALPLGQVWLEISDAHGGVVDRRLLEFLE